MLFNSIEFALFFPIVTLIYFLLPYRFRWFHLLIASCYFYMAFVPIYILILAFTIVIDYYAGIYIERTKGRSRKFLLVISLISNIGILAVFKYYNFLNENLTHLLGLAGRTNPIPFLAILLPIGLSFHTFQAMSYTIEVYRGNQKAEKHFGIYALYVMFYPQLVAGPIERPQNILHQFREKYDFDYERVKSGLMQMGWGLLKKVVIADRLSTFVNPVFNNPYDYEVSNLIVATVFFAIQVYCDFSGYSDIALGSARVMGFRLMTNFNMPYFAENLGTFWRRWHISLSTWFNDYLFTPFITANRDLGKQAIVLGLLLTFSISGLWHGAKWTFIIWGIMHGMGLAFEFYTQKQRKKIFKKVPFFKTIRLGNILTFAFVCLTYIFFRANSIKDGFYILRSIFNGYDYRIVISHIFHGERVLDTIIGDNSFLLALFLTGVFLILEYLQSKYHINKFLFDRSKSPLIRWSVYYMMLICLIFLGVFGSNSFIYFQF